MKKLLFLLIVIISAAIIGGLYYYKPAPKRRKPVATLPLVETISLSKQTYPIYFETFGTVGPSKEVEIVSEVEGVIVKKNPELLPGGILGEGSLLAQIDATDYKLIAEDRRAAVIEAENAIELEEGKQIIARQEWELLKDELETTEQGKNLVLRAPQLRNVRARLDAAKSRLEQAMLDIDKTTLVAPFNALVSENFIEEGQFLSSRSPVAHLISTDAFWVQLSVPLFLLKHLDIPQAGSQTGSSVTIAATADDSNPAKREGSILRLLPGVNPENKMAMLIVTIPDPLNIESSAHDSSEKLLVGSYIRAHIDCGVLKDVFSIPRGALYSENSIWLYADGMLKRQQVNIVWQRKQDVLVSTDLGGEQLVISRLLNPLDGMKVRTLRKKASIPQNREPRK